MYPSWSQGDSKIRSHRILITITQLSVKEFELYEREIIKCTNCCLKILDKYKLDIKKKYKISSDLVNIHFFHTGVEKAFDLYEREIKCTNARIHCCLKILDKYILDVEKI